jgi:hypothetical protein
VEGREHQEHEEQEHRQRRHEARALAIDIAPRQPARTSDQHRQGAPHLAFEMKHAVEQVVPD